MIFGVATNAERLVAVGARRGIGEQSLVGVTWVSDDGRSWRRVEGGPRFFTGSITFAMDRFFAVGCLGQATAPCTVWSSPDGERWAAEFGALGFVYAIRPTDAGLIAVGVRGNGTRPGDAGYSVLSSDGLTWERSPDQKALDNMVLMDVIRVGNGDSAAFQAIGSYDAIEPTMIPGRYRLISPDGLQWQVAERLSDFASATYLMTPSGVLSFAPGAGGPTVQAWADGRWEPVPAEGTPATAGASGIQAAVALSGGDLLVLGGGTAADEAPTIWVGTFEEDTSP